MADRTNAQSRFTRSWPRRALLAAALAAASVLAPRAGGITVFGPETFTRQTGTPVAERRQFGVPSTSMPFTLHVESDGVASATIALNGDGIFAPDDFNPGIRVLE